MNEKGFAPILAILVLLLFIVGIIIAIVMQLESFNQKTFNKSILSDDAKLKPIMENLRERKENLRERKDEMVSEYSKAKEKAEEESPSPAKLEPKSPKPPEGTGDRLDAVHDRLLDGKGVGERE